MSKKIIENVTRIAEPIVSSLGYDVLDIEYGKQPAGFFLTVTIDKEGGGINLDDCEKVHRAIDEPLDTLDELFPEGYHLNVSSPGLDRPLKNEKDFKRNLNKEIEIKFYKPENGRKTVTGKLVSYTDKDLVIETAEGKETVDKKITANITPVIDLKALLNDKGDKE